MAFFDSPKNRAIWNRELGALREERERRAREGYKPQAQDSSKKAYESENPLRKRITLSQLEEQITVQAERSRKNVQRREWSAARRSRKQEQLEPEVLKGRKL